MDLLGSRQLWICSVAASCVSAWEQTVVDLLGGRQLCICLVAVSCESAR